MSFFIRRLQRLPRYGFLRDVVRIIFLSLAAAHARNIGAEEKMLKPIRMWVASSNDARATRFYILGATHYGLPNEYDNYFNRVIRPVFLASDTLHYEGVGNGEDEPYPRCDESVLDAQARAILGHEREVAADLEVATYEELHRRELLVGSDDKLSANERAVYHRKLVASLDEFSLIERFTLTSLVANSFKPEEKQRGVPTPADGFRGAVAENLRSMRPDIRVADLDSRYGVRRAYCNSGNDRIKFLESQFQSRSADSVEATASIPKLEQEFEKLLAGERLPSTSPALALASLDKEFICKRTEAWLDKMVRIHDGKTHFIVVGARHLHDISNEYAACKGFLNGFASRNYLVRPVLSAGE